jgi:minor extracellular serine protease Vpr
VRRIRLTLAVVAAAAMIAAAAPVGAMPPQRTGSSSDAASAGATVDTAYALVQLKGAPLSADVKTKPAPGKKIDFNNGTTKSVRAQLSALRNDFKQWLRANAPKAQVTGSWDISLNAVSVKLNGTSLDTLQAAPQAIRAEYEGLYYPTVDSTVDPDLAMISAVAAWDVAGGSAMAGAGVKVAIVDTGIDITHPCFSDTGYPAQTQIGDRTFTNNKVIVAKVFSNKTPSRGYTAEALQEHGTHVAGTVACDFGTPATVGGVSITHTISGVAPRALLGSYNIFPGDLANARSEDILNALDAAYADGMDIANMSLGGGAHGVQDLLTVAVDNLDQADMVVAVAAGNSGPGHYTVESPGSAARALTAGAATVGHIIATPITVGRVTAAGVTGDFPTVSSNLTANLGVVTEEPTNIVTGLSTACTSLATDLTGKIALISRGVCSFSIKIRNAQNAGAVAVLVANNAAGDGIGMASDGTPDQPTVPAYNVSLNDSAALKAHDSESTTISATPAYIVTGNNDFMADFSSQGPTNVDFRVKPDVVAPGVNVLSSIPHQFCDTSVDTGGCFAFFQGTSMATPHLAGSAAVVWGQHPDWSAAQVRSAIVNTADQGVLKKSSSIALEPDVNIIGAGRENLFSAVNAKVAIDPVSVSFGAVPSGSGQTRNVVVTLTNLGAAATFDVSVGLGSGGVAFSGGGPLTLVVGASGSVNVTMTASKGATLGDHQAKLTVTVGGSEVAHAAVYAFVK